MFKLDTNIFAIDDKYNKSLKYTEITIVAAYQGHHSLHIINMIIRYRVRLSQCSLLCIIWVIYVNINEIEIYLDIRIFDYGYILCNSKIRPKNYENLKCFVVECFWIFCKVFRIWIWFSCHFPFKSPQFPEKKSVQRFKEQSDFFFLWIRFESHVLNDGSNRYFKCNAEAFSLLCTVCTDLCRLPVSAWCGHRPVVRLW